ncbi:MAG: hypothetical protein ACLQVD_01845 [Capsulimonadaceae bacterium]
MKSTNREIAETTLFVGIVILIVPILIWWSLCPQHSDRSIIKFPTGYSVRFQDVKNGETLSGSVPLLVILSTYIDGDTFMLMLDGEQIDHDEDELHVPGSSAGSETLGIDTNMFANGVHTLTVIDGYGKSASVSVRFNNTLQLVSIVTIGNDKGCQIHAVLSTPQSWTVTVRKSFPATFRHDIVIAVFKGKSKTIDLTWDGTDGHHPVNDASFLISAGNQRYEKECNMYY